MNELQIFQRQDFGQVRTVSINGEPWLVGKDVAAVSLLWMAKKSLDTAGIIHVPKSRRNRTCTNRRT